MHAWNGVEWKRERLPGDLPSVVFYHCTTPPHSNALAVAPSHSALIRSLSSLMNTSAEPLQSGNSAVLLCAERRPERHKNKTDENVQAKNRHNNLNLEPISKSYTVKTVNVKVTDSAIKEKNRRATALDLHP